MSEVDEGVYLGAYIACNCPQCKEPVSVYLEGYGDEQDINDKWSPVCFRCGWSAPIVVDVTLSFRLEGIS